MKEIKFNPVPDELMNPAICGINRIEARSNLIPADKRGVFYKNKEESTKLQSLNGDFLFAYETRDSIKDYYKENFDDSNWDIIDVPSMWQFRGYGKCKYPNVEYPFPFDPPYIRTENPVGYYRKRFTATPDEKAILHFGGVDNAFYVFLNGSFVGFSKGSRIPAEFDITPYIRKGENLLAVKVFTYSDASYLENQDMLLASGIFRDVYILHTKRVSLRDFRVCSDIGGFDISAELFEKDADTVVEISIDEDVRTFSALEPLCARFDIPSPKLWSDEEPNLYDLYITLKKQGVPYEIHSKRIGIIKSEIKDGKLLVNDRPIYIKGINRHEYDCKNGRAISVSLIEKELRLIKENNINAIRCSHYPNNPAFYEICSELGIMVMDECDIETHGCSATGDQGYLSKSPEWLPAYLDRTQRSVKQNKNEVCIFMRSVHNESGKGENILACQKYLEKYCPNIAVMHQQQQTFEELTDKSQANHNTVLRCGYLSYDQLKKVIATQPLCFQVEYAHAMGNSPGYLRGYQDAVYKYDNYIGGFAWEFKNHGFWQCDKNGREYYLYGGDFGDKHSWYNFCLDGYLMSDGTPKHSWYELGSVNSPVYAYYDNGFKIRNTYNFKSLGGCVCDWKILEDYSLIKSGRISLPDLAPHDIGELNIDTDIDSVVSGADYYLNLSFLNGKKSIGKAQFKLAVNAPKVEYKPCGKAPDFEISENELRIFDDDFALKISDGVISNYEVNGKTYIDKPLEFNVFRAHTDNDGIFMESSWAHRHAGAWKDARLAEMKFSAYGLSVCREDNFVICKVSGKLFPEGKYCGFIIDLEYRVYSGGIVSVLIKSIPFGDLPNVLPRFGVHLEIDKKYDNVQWYGRGDKENYSDCKSASPVGLYSKKSSETYTVFDMPQESGNHEDTSYLRLYDEKESGLCVVGCDTFAFSFRDVTDSMLEKALHKNEVLPDKKNHLYIDYKMRGLGSRSCGPEPEEEFEFNTHGFNFGFVMGAGLQESEVLALKRLDFGIKTKKAGDEIEAAYANSDTAGLL